MAWDRGDWLNLAGAFAKEDQIDKAAKIKERGEQLAELNKLYMTIASQRYATDETMWAQNYKNYVDKKQALDAIGTSPKTRDEIATALAKFDVGAGEFSKLDDDQQEALLKSYYGHIESVPVLDSKGEAVKDTDGNNVIDKWKVAGNYNPQPLRPEWGTKYYDMALYPDKLDELEESTRGTWTKFLMGEGVDKGDKVLADLQKQLETGSKKINQALSDNYDVGKEYLWNVADEKSMDLTAMELSEEQIDNFNAFLESTSGLEENWNRFVMDWGQPGKMSTEDYVNVKEILKRGLGLSEEDSMALFNIDKQKAKLGQIEITGLSPLGMQYYREISPIIQSTFIDIFNEVRLAPSLLSFEEALDTFNTLATNNEMKNRVEANVRKRTIIFETTDYANIFALGQEEKPRPILLPLDIISNKDLDKLEGTYIVVAEGASPRFATQEDILEGRAVNVLALLKETAKNQLKNKWESNKEAWESITYEKVRINFNNILYNQFQNSELVDWVLNATPKDADATVETEAEPTEAEPTEAETDDDIDTQMNELIEEEKEAKEEEVSPQIVSSNSVPELISTNFEGNKRVKNKTITIEIDGKKQTIPINQVMYVDEENDGTYKKYKYKNGSISSPWIGRVNFDTLNELVSIGLLTDKYIETFNNKEITLTYPGAKTFNDGSMATSMDKQFVTVNGEVYKPTVVEGTNEYGYKIYNVKLKKVTDVPDQNVSDQTAKSILSTNLSNFDIA